MTYTNHESTRIKSHGVRIESREKVYITGVDDVDNFNEGEVNMLTAAGYLTITGNDLHITKLNLDEAQVVVEGNIEGVNYSKAPDQQQGGFFGRIFK